MNNYVVKQPIKDRNDQVVGNEVMFQLGNDDLYNSSEDYMAAGTIANFFMQNNEKIYDGKLVFAKFTPSLLFRNAPKIFDSSKLIIQIEDDVLVNPLSLVIVQKYRKEGYRFAINDFQFSARFFSMLEYVDFLKLNIRNRESRTGEGSMENIVRMAKGFNKQCIAYGVDTKEDYDFAKSLGVDYLQGTYISEATMVKTAKIDFLQGNFFQLVVAVTKEMPDMAEIEEIISRDAYLTYSLIKLINSRYFAVSKKISSIRQALVILGIRQLKEWVYLLSMQNDHKEDGDVAEQVLKRSFLRGIFCSRLARYIDNLPVSPSELYMMGMFSTLSYMVDAPMEEVLNEIPIRDEIKEALLTRSGVCGDLYTLVLDYEKADWTSINQMVKKLGIPSNMVAQFYFDCVEEVNEIWKGITQSLNEEEDQTKTEEE